MNSNELDNYSGKEWRSIDAEDGYYVSEDGYIYNQNYDNVLTNSPARNGYERVNIRGKAYYVHDLVCTAFHGKRPQGYTVEHEDQCKTNNYYKNLSWQTQKVNNNNRTHSGKVSKSLNYKQWRKLFDRYLTGNYSQYDVTTWANTEFKRNSATMVYNNILNGKVYKEWYSQLTTDELDKIQSTITKYKTYYRK
ncbi:MULTISPECIES: HNH endonuclease [Citrobacter freundii complex]|uniref:HNH endonuclease n=1 Tax=Citrobacter freundii complex TaxID=1344959 RepID=UPI001A335125|nr:HNH endonuclease [Citrobacter portucalensis]